jgi:hypothetical protein
VTKDELHLIGHLAHDVAETADVVFIQRRVHLVEQQNGAGLSSKMEKTSATAVRAFSPPESWLIELFRLPGAAP